MQNGPKMVKKIITLDRSTKIEYMRVKTRNFRTRNLKLRLS